MTATLERTANEWIGGLVSMPNYVTGEGELYRPDALFWMDADGAVLGNRLGKPGELVAVAAESLRSTVERPRGGPARAPARVRVASPELADALRTGQAGVEIVCAPTPEIDGLLESLRERMGKDEDEESHISSEIGPDAVGAFFRAAAGLFRARLGEIVPRPHDVLAVTIEELGVRDAVLSALGETGSSLGFVLFFNHDAFEAFVDVATAIARGERPTKMPGHVALHFEPEADLSAARRTEILQHRWEVAGTDAYPWVSVIDEDTVVGRSATAKEITLTETIALALTKLLEEKDALLAAWKGGEIVERAIRVASYTGDFEVKFRVPYEQESSRFSPPYDVLAGLSELERDSDGDELDNEVRSELEDELVRRFMRSPEANGLSDVWACRSIMEFASNFFGVTIASLKARQLEEIVFEIVPRKISTDASEARSIIDESRAFYAFLKREFGLKQADECLDVLAGDAVEALEAALSDSDNFGMAKSMFMAGRKAGFDMLSPEGIEAWMRVVQSRTNAGWAETRPLLGARSRPANSAAAREKKKQRKAVRKARKKNR
jgi:hypothetical protein